MAGSNQTIEPHQYVLSGEELKSIIDVELLKQKFDTHTVEYAAHQKRNDEVLDLIFKKLSSIKDNQKDFPLQMAQCKSEVDDTMRKEYITKVELRTMLRTAMYVAGIAVAIINGVFVWAVTQHTIPQQQSVLMQEMMVEIKKEINAGRHYDNKKITPR